MLTLLTSIGLTQASLAERLHVTRKAVGRWEAGDTYPKASHLKTLLAFALGQQAFPAGREEEEIRAFWHAAHQKVLLDEQWLQGLLGTQRPRLALVASGPGEQTYGAEHVSAPPSNDAWASCWSICATGVRSSCWITWRRCWRKAQGRVACVRATRAMDSCCAGWARPRTRVACCLPAERKRASW